MKYVDVILPLPLDGLFTYSLPDTMSDGVVPGVRVLVPLGRSKTYTAVVTRVYDEKPDFKTRDIMQVLDAQPVLLPRGTSTRTPGTTPSLIVSGNE